MVVITIKIIITRDHCGADLIVERCKPFEALEVTAACNMILSWAIFGGLEMQHGGSSNVR